MADDLVFFTICARNFLANALALHRSVMAAHPAATFYLFLADASDGLEPFALPFEVVPLERLVIDKLEDMKWYYNITEFCTSIKPFAFGYLLAQGCERIVYLDPDIVVFSPFREVEQAFARGINCILTPHLTQPEPMAEIDDLRLVQLGAFNLGFCALQGAEETTALIEWWRWRLRTHCLIDLPKGLFVDQKFADLFPSFVSQFLSLRHPGYNLAYWNFHQRPLSKSDGQYRVGNELLRFVHFSGFDPSDTSRLTRHIGRAGREHVGLLAEIMDDYAESLVALGSQQFRELPYAFNWNGDRGENIHTPAPAVAPDQTAPVTVSARGVRHVGLAAKGALAWLTKEPLGRARLRRAFAALRRVGIRQLVDALAFAAARPQPEGGTAPNPGRLRGRIPRATLVIDWSLPNPATDAGGAFTYEMIKALVEAGQRVTVLPLEFASYPFAPLYDALGVIVVGPYAAPSALMALRQMAGQFDVIVLNRAPAVHPILADVQAAFPTAQLILNAHDLHYLRERRRSEIEPGPGAAQLVAVVREQERAVFAAVDAVLFVSDVESYVAAELVADLPTLQVPLVVGDPAPSAVWSPERRRLVFVGSFKHLPNVDAVGHFAATVWSHLRASQPDLEWHIVGADFPADLAWVRQLDGVSVLGQVPDLSRVFADALASIAPLRFGAGVKGKLLTSWSFGVPAVGSGLAAEGLAAGADQAFAIAEDSDGYLTALGGLRTEPDWSRASHHAMAYVGEHYSRHRLKAQLQALMRGLSEGLVPVPNSHAIADAAAYDRHCERTASLLEERRKIEARLLEGGADIITSVGYCAICRAPSQFITRRFGSEAAVVWPEQLICATCGYTARLRGLCQYLAFVSLPDAPVVLVLGDMALQTLVQKTLGGHPAVAIDAGPFDLVVAVGEHHQDWAALLKLGGHLLALDDLPTAGHLAIAPGATGVASLWEQLAVLRQQGLVGAAHTFWSDRFQYLGDDNWIVDLVKGAER